MIYETIEKDMEEVKTILRKKFIHLHDSELFYIKQKLLHDDWKLLQKIYLAMSKQPVNIVMDSQLRLDKELLFLSGNYMENLKIVLHTEGE